MFTNRIAKAARSTAVLASLVGLAALGAAGTANATVHHTGPYSSAEAQLLAALPSGYDYHSACTFETPVGFQLAVVHCDDNTALDGPTEAFYVLYADSVDLNFAFTNLLNEDTLVECPDGPSPAPWQYENQPNVPAGSRACNIDQGSPEIIWTNEVTSLLGIATVPSRGADLFDWWLQEG